MNRESTDPEKHAVLRRLRPSDYVFLIGVPILFFVIAFFGLRKIVGPIPTPSAVELIKDGEIKEGMTTQDVLDKLGPPKEIDPAADGSATIIYTRTVDDGDLVLEEGVVSVDANGHVVEAHAMRAPVKPGS